MQDISTEEKILQAARKIFVDKGLEGARMQDIADEAGINKALLHYYFRSKEKLFETIFSRVASEFMPRMFDILESDQCLFKKIELFCFAYIEQETKTPYVPIFIIHEINRDPKALIKKVFNKRKPPFKKVLIQIEEETKRGIIKPIDPIQLLLNIISLCIFPYLARPMIQTITGMKMDHFNEMMKERCTTVSKMIIDSIKA
ncbi:MAG TPA: TetR/AcrR family transcriptional regulator [Flavisolibacter sp.]|nr:TetR/AcrR family transcriptional regulator [Flavisolibacter sp.]